MRLALRVIRRKREGEDDGGKEAQTGKRKEGSKDGRKRRKGERAEGL